MCTPDNTAFTTLKISIFAVMTSHVFEPPLWRAAVMWPPPLPFWKCGCYVAPPLTILEKRLLCGPPPYHSGKVAVMWPPPLTFGSPSGRTDGRTNGRTNGRTHEKNAPPSEVQKWAHIVAEKILNRALKILFLLKKKTCENLSRGVPSPPHSNFLRIGKHSREQGI